MMGLTRILICPLLVLALATDVAATTARRLSNRELVEQSDVIVIGRATGVRSAWEGRILVTVVDVMVTETIKGESAGTISVALPGGIDADRPVPISMVYAGAPTIAMSEDVFLFLVRDEDIASGYIVAGFSQGKFSIVTEPGGRTVVSRDLTNIQLQSTAGISRGTVAYTSLADFKAEIAEYLK